MTLRRRVLEDADHVRHVLLLALMALGGVDPEEAADHIASLMGP